RRGRAGVARRLCARAPVAARRAGQPGDAVSDVAAGERAARIGARDHRRQHVLERRPGQRRRRLRVSLTRPLTIVALWSLALASAKAYAADPPATHAAVQESAPVARPALTGAI